MNAKEYLEQLSGLHLEVQMMTDKRNHLLELTKELNQMNESTTRKDTDIKAKDRLKLAVEVSELLDQVTASQNELIRFKIEALNYIDQVDHEMQRIALRLRYGQGLDKKEIAAETFYSTRHITNLINNGTQGLQEIFDKKG